MVHARVSDEYIHFELMYTTDNIFPVLPIKNSTNKDIEPNMPHKLATDTKPSVENLRVLLCPCVVRKATAHGEKNALNMYHQSQKGFCGNFAGIPQHQKGYFIYVPITQKIVSSHDIVFDEIFSGKLAYTSNLYSEALAM